MWARCLCWLAAAVGAAHVTTPTGNPVTEVDPDFLGPIRNVTVAVGREAVLNCTVTELGPYRVGWMKADDQTILTLHTRVVTHNSRIGVSQDGPDTWQLRIRQLKEADRGCYMCQINTSNMKKQLGCVDVHVPPEILDGETSGDVTAREGENATLVCHATGRPQPRIVWRREDGDRLLFGRGDGLRVDTYAGDSLTLTKLDRRRMGAYLCIASNDIPPAVSKRILLNVNFAPAVRVPNQLLGAPLGTDVHLECYVEAFPDTVNYWVKNGGDVPLSGYRHLTEELRLGPYRVHLRLTIVGLGKRDLGTYACVATNSLGKDEGTIRLYEIKIQTTTTTTTTTTTSTTTAAATTITTNPTQKSRQITVNTTARRKVIATATTEKPLAKNTVMGSSPNEFVYNGGGGRISWAAIATVYFAGYLAS